MWPSGRILRRKSRARCRASLSWSVVAVLESCVMRNRRRFGQLHLAAVLHQRVGESVRIEGRFHDHRRNLVAERFKFVLRCRRIIGQTLAQRQAILIVDHREHVVRGMQINRSLKCHGRLHAGGEPPKRGRLEGIATAGRRRHEFPDCSGPRSRCGDGRYEGLESCMSHLAKVWRGERLKA